MPTDHELEHDYRIIKVMNPDTFNMGVRVLWEGVIHKFWYDKTNPEPWLELKEFIADKPILVDFLK